MTRRILIPIAIGAALLAVPTTSASPSGATLLIRHQVHGCHAWSANGGPFKAAQTLRLARGAALTVVNNDVMPHKLVQTGGAKIAVRTMPSSMADMSHELSGHGVMAHMGAAVKMRFSKAGVYTFTTRAGEDYMKGMATKGEDNVLRLKVVVS